MYEPELLLACEESDLEQIKYYLTQSADVNARNERNATALMVCIAQGFEEGMELLLANGADPELFDDEDSDALLFAQGYGIPHIMAITVRSLAQRQRWIESSPKDSDYVIVCKLITTLLYKSNRHAWDHEPCTKLREYIELLVPAYQGYSRHHYVDVMNQIETRDRNFYGSYLSDDSDSEDEKTFVALSKGEQGRIKAKQQVLVRKAQVDGIIYKKKQGDFVKGDLKLNAQDGSKLFDLNARLEIPDQVATRRLTQDLESLNKAFRRYKNDPQGFNAAALAIQTQFVVAQYRGVSYPTISFNKPRRIAHRNKNEIGRSVLSATVHHKIGIHPGDFDEAVYNNPQIAQQTNEIVTLTQQILKSFNANTPCKYRGDAFFTLSDLLHNYYSKDYHGFHHLIKTDPYIKELLVNHANPFVSTGDIPYHALKYAFAMKPYIGHKHERLRPRWQINGRAERPYSGKVYISLHPISDYLNTENVYHVISRLWQGRINLTTTIAPECETTFAGVLQADRVVAQYKAKYPSFAGDYKDIYLEKYGMGPDLYNQFKQALQQAPPHTPANRHFKILLGEWLCSFYEVKAIHTAKHLAGNRVLVYRNEQGEFSLTPPRIASPMQSGINENVRTPIKTKNDLRRQSASPESPHVEKAALIPALPRALDEDELDLNIDEDGSEGPGLIAHILLQAILHNMQAAFTHFLRSERIRSHVNDRFNDIYRFKNAHLLHAAVYHKSLTMVELILNVPEVTANPIADETTHEPWHDYYYLEKLTPFLTAIVENNAELVRFFLNHPMTDRNACAQAVTNKDKLSDLLNPAEGNVEEDAGYLGSFLCAREVYSIERVKNLTPIHLAVRFASPEILQMLLAAGFDPSLEDSDRETPEKLAQYLKKDAHMHILQPATTRPLTPTLGAIYNHKPTRTDDLDDLSLAFEGLFSTYTDSFLNKI